MLAFFQGLNDEKFHSTHVVYAPVGNSGEVMVVLTGLVEVQLWGKRDAHDEQIDPGGRYHRDKVEIGLRFPGIIPPGQSFHVKQWAPFITLNAIDNAKTAFNAGWAVDRFYLVTEHHILNDGTGHGQAIIGADLAVSDVDGVLNQIGYSLTVFGEFGPAPDPIP